MAQNIRPVSSVSYRYYAHLLSAISSNANQKRFGTENNENINHYEMVIPLLSRIVLTKLVVDLGGVADEAQMMLDSYKYVFVQVTLECQFLIQRANSTKSSRTRVLDHRLG